MVQKKVPVSHHVRVYLYGLVQPHESFTSTEVVMHECSLKDLPRVLACTRQYSLQVRVGVRVLHVATSTRALAL